MKKLRGIVAAMLLLCMLMAGSLTAFAAEQPAQNQEKAVWAEGTTRAKGVLTVFVNKTCDVVGEGIRLRRTPGDSGEVLGLLYEEDGAWVYTSGVYESIGDRAWLEVTNSSIGQSGWIALEYVRVRN